MGFGSQYQQMEEATSYFSEEYLLGRGSHGSIYKAQLPSSGRIVAVKRPSRIRNRHTPIRLVLTPASVGSNNTSFTSTMTGGGSRNEVENEIDVLSRIHGPRLVNLVGFTTIEPNEDGRGFSRPLARHSRSVLHLLKATLDAIDLPIGRGLPFTVADLGCSCGPNTIITVDHIIAHISKLYQQNSQQMPDFQAFFSDLTSNDFNQLFQLLPEQCNRDKGMTKRSYYAAGVPGSFYGRLFPSNTIDVFHSAFSLHWLSQVPEDVTDKRSEGFNKGKVFVHGASEGTAMAYRKQFQSDLAMFLKCRAEEMRDGGVMFLVCFGRTSANPADQGGVAFLFGTHFQDAWEDLVQEGLVEAEKRDGFNLPVYAASLEEFKEVVEENGQFELLRLDLVHGGSPLVLSHPDDATEVGRALVNGCRSVCGVLVEAHTGESLADEIFTRLELRATADAKNLVREMQFFHIAASLSFRSAPAPIDM